MTRRALMIILGVLCIGVLSHLIVTMMLCKRYFYHSPDRQRTVTRLEYLPIILPELTYFTEGKYEGMFPPKSYIRPVYSGRDGGFVLLMHWTDSSCVLFFPYGKYDSSNTTNEFQLQKLDGNSKEWKQIAGDTLTGHSKLLTEYLF